MKNEIVTPKNQDEFVSGTNTEQENERKVYHTPKLLKYGGLAELVQRRPNLGADGSGFPDCTLT